MGTSWGSECWKLWEDEKWEDEKEQKQEETRKGKKYSEQQRTKGLFLQFSISCFESQIRLLGIFTKLS